MPKGWVFKAPQKTERVILGVGLNDLPYSTETRIGGVYRVCPVYKTWKHMLERSTGRQKLLATRPTYRDVVISQDWLRLSNFSKWFLPALNKSKLDLSELHLDKDILSSTRIYSEQTSLLVPKWLNSYVTCKGKGWSFCSREQRFFSQIEIDGRQKFLGYHKDKDAAIKAYIAAKTKHINSLTIPRYLPVRRVRSRIHQILLGHLND